MKLDEELDGNAEERGNEQQAGLAPGEPHAAGQRNRQHAQARKQKAVEHHILHAHLVEREPAEIKARTP